MKKTQKNLGDEHVRDVYEGLEEYLKTKNIESSPHRVRETVFYIAKLFPDIILIKSKFDEEKPDKAKDLSLYLGDGRQVNINLFLIKKGGKIQPKNPGAKSFISKYFLSTEVQKVFNIQFEENQNKYLYEVLKHKIGEHYIKDLKTLKKRVSDYYPNFTKEIDIYREKFLYSIREVCFTLFKDFYNNKDEGFFNAYNQFLLAEDINIITYYGNQKEDVTIEEFSPGSPAFNEIELYKVGKYTLGIKYGEIGLRLRFKFESSPVSSIKIATSFEYFKDLVGQSHNINTMKKFNDLLSSHCYAATSNSSNAIGKCHEAITYYYFLKELPNISQVEQDDCVKMLARYYTGVSPETLNKLFQSTSTLVPTIREHLLNKYVNYKVESIEIVADSYVQDKLETGDLQLTLKVYNSYVTENISLKAIARKNNKITTKNPGIGSILGPTYFNIGSMEHVVNEVKSKYISGELNHKQSLEYIANELGLSLSKANQSQLKQGIENLLGKALTAITIYEEGISVCKQHDKITSSINVYTQKPTNIQNTLAWDNDLESISLRVKFSKGQKYGWSTIKLTSEYLIK